MPAEFLSQVTRPYGGIERRTTAAAETLPASRDASGVRFELGSPLLTCLLAEAGPVERLFDHLMDYAMMNDLGEVSPAGGPGG